MATRVGTFHEGWGLKGGRLLSFSLFVVAGGGWFGFDLGSVGNVNDFAKAGEMSSCVVVEWSLVPRNPGVALEVAKELPLVGLIAV